MLSQKEIDNLVSELLKLKQNFNLSKSLEDYHKFQIHQNLCIEKLKFLVEQRASRYRKFSNHPDLEQDGLEALLLAFKTYDPSKGSFCWWANKYISTKIARSASAHSVIKIPIKKTKIFKPHKVSSIPILADEAESPEINFQNLETSKILSASINKLSAEQQKIINYYYGFNNSDLYNIENIAKKMNMTKIKVSRLLHQSEKLLRKYLTSESLAY